MVGSAIMCDKLIDALIMSGRSAIEGFSPIKCMSRISEPRAIRIGGEAVAVTRRSISQTE